MPKEVNFSDKTTPRTDPHDWVKHLGGLMVRGRVIQTIDVWICSRCQFATVLPPRHLHDLPPCVSAEPMECQKCHASPSQRDIAYGRITFDEWLRAHPCGPTDEYDY